MFGEFGVTEVAALDLHVAYIAKREGFTNRFVLVVWTNSGEIFFGLVLSLQANKHFAWDTRVYRGR